MKITYLQCVAKSDFILRFHVRIFVLLIYLLTVFFLYCIIFGEHLIVYNLHSKLSTDMLRFGFILFENCIGLIVFYDLFNVVLLDIFTFEVYDFVISRYCKFFLYVMCVFKF